MTADAIRTAAPVETAANRLRVVVADDDPLQSGFVAAVLESLGHDSIEVHDGEGALSALASSGATVLVCDIDMPGRDGIEVARAVRERDWGRYVYVLLVTARNRSDDYERGLLAGADDFMQKPIVPAVLTVRIKAAERLLRYQAEVASKTARLADAHARLERDLRAAGRAQQAILPLAGLTTPAYSAWPLFMPSQHVSGDMFGFFELPGHRLGFYAADVAGHGVRAALLAATVGHVVDAGLFAETVVGPSGELRPSRLVGELNRRFQSVSDSEDYFTLACGVVDPARGVVVVSQAGHPSPLVVGADGATRWLGEGGLPVGLFPEVDAADVTAPFGPGDRLVVHSDGIVEAMSEDGEPFGGERLAAIMGRRRRDPPAEAARALVAELTRWTEGLGLEDDVSMIVIDSRRPRDA